MVVGSGIILSEDRDAFPFGPGRATRFLTVTDDSVAASLRTRHGADCSLTPSCRRNFLVPAVTSTANHCERMDSATYQIAV